MAASALSLIAATTVARAQPARAPSPVLAPVPASQPWTLSYHAPEGCGDADTFRRSAEAQRARAEPPPPQQVTVAIDLDEAGRWHVRIAIAATAEDTGERQLDGDSCRVVFDAASLIVALALDAASEPPPPPPRRRPVTLAPPPAAPPRPQARLSVRAAGQADVGTLPAFSAGGRLDFLVSWRRLRLWSGFGRLARVDRQYSDDAGLAADAWHIEVGGGARVWSGLEVGLLFESGQIDVTSFGVTVPGARRVPWNAFGAATEWCWSYGAVDFSLGIQWLWPIQRQEFVVADRVRDRAGPSLRPGFAATFHLF